MRYTEQEQENKIQLIDNKTSLIIGYIETNLEGGFKAVPYHGHKQTSLFSFLPCAKGYIAACFYNRGARCNHKKSTSEIIELTLKL